MDPPPIPASGGESSSSALDQSPVFTYHCLCTHLIVATTTPLSALFRRSASSLDKAYILPLPSPTSARSRASDDSDSETEAQTSTSSAKPTTLISPTRPHYALLLSAVTDRKPQIITRIDGFEKRYLQRCGRCRLVVGYQLDWGQYADADTGTSERTGRREDVVYLLPGGLLSTEEMFEGRNMAPRIEFGNGMQTS